MRHTNYDKIGVNETLTTNKVLMPNLLQHNLSINKPNREATC